MRITQKDIEQAVKEIIERKKITHKIRIPLNYPLDSFVKDLQNCAKRNPQRLIELIEIREDTEGFGNVLLFQTMLKKKIGKK